jgi:RNA polymerase sigma factor for flagellar operon FliA
MSSSITQKLRKLKDYRCKINQQLKDQIIVEYAPLVRFIAQKIASRLPANVELDDLISCGVIGLMDAIDKFDPGRDNKFKTYAEFRIRGAILDELRAQDWVPRSVREKAKLVERKYVELERSLGRPATDDEMCKHMSMTLDEFHDLVGQAQSISLLNIDDLNIMKNGDKKLLGNLMEDRRGLNPFAATNFKNIQELLKDGIQSLPEKQKLVLSLYYYEDLNLKEIGMVLEVTESRVSQLHTQAVLRLRAKLRKEFESEEDLQI